MASGAPWVFWILGAVFLAVGVHLYLHGRRRSRLLRRFAIRNGLSYEARRSDSLEEELTETFRLSGDRRVRAFSRVRDVVSDGRVRLFKCVELLDLSPWGESQNLHFPRIAVLFPVDPRCAHWALYHSGGSRPKSAAPGSFAYPPVSREMEAVLAAHPPGHPLSVTLARGQGLAYLEPLRVGSEQEEELRYLLQLGRMLADRFDEASRAVTGLPS
ncbi:MAG: hypothetical protein ACRDLA_00390 [Thermoleophilaceae bacterium]